MNKHAFLIIAHQGLENLRCLLELLDDARNDIYLHIDKRSVMLYQEVENISLKYSSLIIIEPMKVYWGHLSLVEVEYKLFEEAFSHGPYLYYHLLSGVDLPIKHQDYIHDFFNRHVGYEFVGFWMEKKHQQDLRRRVRRYHFFVKYFKGGGLFIHNMCAFLRNICLSLQKLLPIYRHRNLEFQKGSNWVSITNNFCKYLLEHKEETMRIFNYTLCPDEIFLQTILWNSPFKKQIFNIEDPSLGSMRAIDWTRGNPYVWKNSDVDILLSSPYLFARKFSENDQMTREKIRMALHNKYITDKK